MTKSTSKMVWGLVVLIVLLAIWFAYQNKHKAVQQAADQLAQVKATETQPVKGTKPQASTTLHKSLTYTQAVNTYANRIQFSDCHGSVGLSSNGLLSIKQGVAFMLDNHDAKAHTIAFGSQSYKVGANDFAIVSAAKIGNYAVTCDGGGAASLNVE